LLDVAPKNRAAAEAFAAAIPEALAPIKDFIVTGQSFTSESGLMVNELSTFAGIYRNAMEAVSSGAMSDKQAREYLATQLEANADAIAAEAERTTRTFGVAPDALIQEGVALGAAVRSVREMVEAGVATDEARGTDVPAGTMDDTLGKLEQTLNNVQSEIQNVFLDSVALMAPAITKVADGVDGTAEAIGDFKRLLEGVVSGDFSAVNDALGTNLQNNTTNTMMENLTEVIAAGIEEGFRRLLGDSWVGSRLIGDPDEYLAPENYTAPMGNLGLGNRYDGMATGGIAVGPDSGYPMELHGTEAVVPLPDGRSIPVEMTTSGIRGLIEAMAMQESTDNNAGTSGISLAAIQDNFANSQPLTAQNLASSFDNTRTLPELVQVNKSMLAQLSASTQKLDQMVRALEESNTISRNSAYARA
jgi:hypothetical protein